MLPTVLIVDDDIASCYAMTRALTGEGFQVLAYEDALTAWAAISDPTARYDLLLTDVKFPPGQPHGIALARHSRIVRPGAPVMFMTAYPDAQELAGEDGATFLKPVNLPALVEAIRGALPEARPQP
jgi:DNA-binding NtrC family response regulator